MTEDWLNEKQKEELPWWASTIGRTIAAAIAGAIYAFLVENAGAPHWAVSMTFLIVYSIWVHK